MTFDETFAACPLVAILRGVRPDEVEAIAEAVIAAGIALVEVPMNSPDPLKSVTRLVKRFGDRALIGAGTVLDVATVEDLARIGAHMVISPNMDPGVIRASRAAGLVSLPGVFTPSEAFTALSCGADALKLFPAEGASPAMLKAIRTVLPAGARILPVGGIAPDTMKPWFAAGAAGFGLGSALYKAGDMPETVAARARAFVTGLAGVTGPGRA